MRFLEHPGLSRISALLKDLDVGDRILSGRLELFSLFEPGIEPAKCPKITSADLPSMRRDDSQVCIGDSEGGSDPSGDVLDPLADHQVNFTSRHAVTPKLTSEPLDIGAVAGQSADSVDPPALAENADNLEMGTVARTTSISQASRSSTLETVRTHVESFALPAAWVDNPRLEVESAGKPPNLVHRAAENRRGSGIVVEISSGQAEDMAGTDEPAKSVIGTSCSTPNHAVSPRIMLSISQGQCSECQDALPYVTQHSSSVPDLAVPSFDALTRKRGRRASDASTCCSGSLQPSAPSTLLPSHLGKHRGPKRRRSSSASSSSCGFLGTQTLGEAKKLLIQLVTTLNACFPDYDFSSVTPNAFQHVEDFVSVYSTINYHLSFFVERVVPGFLQDFWTAIKDAVDLRRVSIYSYTNAEGTIESDPFQDDDACLFAFDYFFVDEKGGRILFVSCMTKKKEMSPYPSSDDEFSGVSSEREMLSGGSADSLELSEGEELIDGEIRMR